MYIAVKSEMDSRVLVYPLMRALKSYGSILVISSNNQLRRLIDDPAYQTFRNMTILINEAGAVDEVYSDWGIAPGDYDFVILDNMGCLDYDVCFILQGSKSSQEFLDDLEILRESSDIEKIVCVQFGAKAKPEKKERPPRQDRNAKTEPAEITQEEYDPAAKFRKKAKLDEKNVAQFKEYTGKFPTFDQIEKLEGEHIFYPVDSGMVQMFYKTFEKEIGSDYNQFRKEVAKRDEGGCDIKPVNANR